MYSNYTIQILNFHLNVIELTSIFLLSCAFIKSAQFGPHIWLPDSMEAPVPASPLKHKVT
jgi:NADH:ubiquinone oxidoreductase subunit 5 (subunit L)/multisubunit Na+/H+ antiporter MnhA subunit